jgi:hypothetical protein
VADGLIGERGTVAPADEFPGLGPRTDRPRPNRFADLTRLQLTPTEGFVLSRIDGCASYEEICQMSALGREQTLEILRKLKRAALILGPHEAGVGPPAGPKPGQAPPAERVPRTPPPVPVTDAMLRKAQALAGGKPEQTPEPGSLLARLDDDTPVAPADLIEGHDLPIETKRRIIRLHRKLRKLAPHELLGVPENADKATVKRAFGAASKELHPDRYYGKDLGSFGARLAKIFARVTEVVQELERARKSR